MEEEHQQPTWVKVLLAIGMILWVVLKFTVKAAAMMIVIMFAILLGGITGAGSVKMSSKGTE